MTRTSLAALSLICFINASAGASSVVDRTFPNNSSNDHVVTLTLSDIRGDADLLIPADCSLRKCPLIIVSHGREAKPTNELRSPEFHKLFDVLTKNNYVVLLSEDAGPETWGNDAALNYIMRMFKQAKARFLWNGGVFTIGISMGGLPAILTAYRQTLGIPVKAIALIAGRVNLLDAFVGPKDRSADIDKAYSTSFYTSKEYAHDPIADFYSYIGNKTPVLAIVSSQDDVVNSKNNGELLVKKSKKLGVESNVYSVEGQHLGSGYLNAEVATKIVSFFEQHK